MVLIAFLPSVADRSLTVAARSEQALPVLVLENAHVRLEVDRQHGRLLRLLDKRGQIDLKSPAELAENFRLLVPTPEDARNFVYGRDQVLSASELAANSLTLRWDGPMKDQHGATHKLAATMRIELADESVMLGFTLSNDTDAKIPEVWYGGMGGLLAFGPSDSCDKTTLAPPPHNARRLTRPFGQYSIGYPGSNMGFVDASNPVLKRSLYLGAHDPVARFKVFSFLEVGQGNGSDVVAFLTHYPFTPPGARFEGSPLVVQFHDGDWIAAGRQIYKPWFTKQFGLMKPDDDWIRRQSFFQMIMIMLPEGNVNYPIREIPQLAKDGLKYGLTSLQIAGWQFGGHDNGYPYYEPDPRLGTYDDLKEAIRQCHAMGVKIYFFANIHVANVDTEWYKNELKDYNFEWKSGHACWVAGWGMGTLGSRMGLTAPLMAFADPSFPKFADAQLAYFKKLAEIGADGIHIDKGFPQPINYNPRIVMSPDRSGWEGTVRLVERIDRECRALNPDWRMSFETNYDRMLSFGAATWWAGNMSIARKVFPELVETVGLSAPYDYVTVNDAVCSGHVVMVDPHAFCRSMDYEPFRGLASYIRDVKKIRDELADYVFLGEQLDAGEAAFAPDPPRPGGIDHAVYRNLKNGKRACIITSKAASPVSVTLTAFKGGQAGKVRLYRPGQEASNADLPASISLDPERLTFVVEN